MNVATGEVINIKAWLAERYPEPSKPTARILSIVERLPTSHVAIAEEEVRSRYFKLILDYSSAGADSPTWTQLYAIARQQLIAEKKEEVANAPKSEMHAKLLKELQRQQGMRDSSISLIPQATQNIADYTQEVADARVAVIAAGDDPKELTKAQRLLKRMESRLDRQKKWLDTLTRALVKEEAKISRLEKAIATELASLEVEAKRS